MELKQSTSIMFSNFGLVFKIMLYMLIAALIFVSLASAIIIPVFRQIKSDVSMDALLNETEQDITTFLQGDANIIDTYDKLVADVKAILKTFLAAQGTIAGVCIGMALIYLLYKFLMALSFIPTSDILNNFMSSNLRYGFVSNYTLNFRRSVRFAATKVLVFIPVDIVIYAVLGVVFLGLWQLIKYFSLPLVFALALFLMSLRQAVFAGWIPRIIFHPEEKMLVSLKKSYDETKEYRKNFVAIYMCVYFLYWALQGSLATATFGIMVLISPAMNYVITRIVELVSYYKIHRMRFYTDANNVVNTIAVGMREEDQEKL